MNSLYTEHKNIRSFLSAISLTESQINELTREYPNIIELCIEDRINEIELSKLYGIGSYIIKVIQRKIKNSYPLINIMSAFGGLLDYRTSSLLYSKYQSINEILKRCRRTHINVFAV